jgi:hypothetical protein
MSDPTEDPDLSTPADFLVKVTELGVRAQSAVLQAEMDLLAQVMSGMTGPAVPHPTATDAEVESGFDNMPV